MLRQLLRRSLKNQVASTLGLTTPQLRAMSVEIEDSHKVLCAERSSIAIAVEEGKDYWWCSCGRSKNQPFCDGSHSGTEFRPKVLSIQLYMSSPLIRIICRRSTRQPSRRMCTFVAASRATMLLTVMGPTERCPRTPRTSSSLPTASPERAALSQASTSYECQMLANTL